MKILIIDDQAEGQAEVAKLFESVPQADREMLDIRLKLVTPDQMGPLLEETDVAVLGVKLGDKALATARAIRDLPNIHIMMVVSEEVYSQGQFRETYSAGVQKIIPSNASTADLIQAFSAIYQELRRIGKVREGKVVTVTHAKGGVGGTGICAALAELCSLHGRKTLLWDLDVETRDLCRSLLVSGHQAQHVSRWVKGEETLDRDSLEAAAVSISEEVSVLMPPADFASAMELVCDTEAIALCSRVIELARNLYDVVIVDTGGRVGPGVGAVMRSSDQLVVVIDDTILGLTAVDIYLGIVTQLVSKNQISFLVNGFTGKLVNVPEMADTLSPAHDLPESVWRLPPIPDDLGFIDWTGTMRTPYSKGSDETRQALEKTAIELGLVSEQVVQQQQEELEQHEPKGLARFFKR